MNNRTFYMIVLVIALILGAITVSCTGSNTKSYDNYKTQEDFEEIIVEVTLVFEEGFDFVMDFNGIDYNDLDEQIAEFIQTSVIAGDFVEPIAVLIRELHKPNIDESIIGTPEYLMVYGKI